MTDPRRSPDTAGKPGVPRWVKVSGLIALVSVLLLVGLMLVLGGSHGPDRHAPPAGARGHTPPSGGAEFTLGDAAMQQQHADEMAEMDDRTAHGGPNSITLQPGQTEQLTWRFGDAGTIEYACHEPGHYQAGMRGHVTIT